MPTLGNQPVLACHLSWETSLVVLENDLVG